MSDNLPDSIDFEAVFALLPTPFMLLDRNMRYVAMNEAYLTATHSTRERLMGQYIFDVFPETGDRHDILKNSLQCALNGTRDKIFQLPYAIPDATSLSGFKHSYWNAVHTPLRDKSGTVTHVIQQTIDITAQFETEQQNKIISTELDHRVKNMLAIVSTIGRRTGRDAVTIDGFLKTFDARLQAMARTHTLLADAKWSGANLRTLVEQEIAPFGAQDCVHIEGPDLMLDTRKAQALSMAMHELATNASKYGALSSGGGTLQITWSVLPEGGFTLTWRETLNRTIAPPKNKGFGSTIIDEVTPRQMDAQVCRTYERDGVLFTLTTTAKEPAGAFQT